MAIAAKAARRDPSHAIGQPQGVQVCWGQGLFVDQVGGFVGKRMSECTGKEPLRELLGLDKEVSPLYTGQFDPSGLLASAKTLLG